MCEIVQSPYWSVYHIFLELRSVKQLGVMVIFVTFNAPTLYVVWTSIVVAGVSYDTPVFIFIDGHDEESRINFH